MWELLQRRHELKVRITTEETGTKGNKYYKRDRKMEAYKVKVRITRGETGTLKVRITMEETGIKSYR